MSREGVHTAFEEATEAELEPPRPLMREMPPADPYPTDALGNMLAGAARAIHDRVQAPLAICGQSVLAAATLAVQGHANVKLPMGHTKPVSSYFISVAATGERKSAVDTEALAPVLKREAALREAFAGQKFEFENAEAAWKKARDEQVKVAKGDQLLIKEALDVLGPVPQPPLEPILTCSEPTFEGLCKLLAVGQPSMGIFAAEGGQFIGGHGMNDEAKLRTVAGLSAAWDGEPIKRIRALDGFSVLSGRRVTMHLMAQPAVASILLADRLLIDQGLLSRVLVTAPPPASGTRLWREPSPKSEMAMKAYSAGLLHILERAMPLAPGARNELVPRVLPLSSQARKLWIGLHDHIEERLGVGGELEPVRGFANKLPEHAARIAAVLTLVRDLEAGELEAAEMEAGIEIAQHHADEAKRLHGMSHVSIEMHNAQLLLSWLESWPEPVVSLPDIYQFGPNPIRDKNSARRVVEILVDHGWLAEERHGCEIKGTFRRQVWRIVRA
jgi:hypothetical protein